MRRLKRQNGKTQLQFSFALAQASKQANVSADASAKLNYWRAVGDDHDSRRAQKLASELTASAGQLSWRASVPRHLHSRANC